MKRPALHASRTLAIAIAVSAIVHAAFMAGLPARWAEPPAAPEGKAYVATLVPPPHNPDDLPRPAEPKTPKKPATPRAARHARPHPRPVPAPPPQSVAQAAPQLVAAAEPLLVPQPLEPLAEPHALAALDTFSPIPEPPPELAAVEPGQFPVEALPDDLEINYTLTSAVADAHAVYRWQREGDRYRITGEGSADGFFSLFLAGTLLQESEGTVTSSGLKPARFVEKKPDTPDEGLEFDWTAHQVTYEYGDNNRKTGKLAENAVDWLSMIFQLAHVPPPGGAREMKLSVLTQRKQYRFDLQVVGEEDIVIPLGHVRTLHLRHIDRENPKEVVDVWLGTDQHYLPVKLRYPVARNRFTVEQSATRVSSR